MHEIPNDLLDMYLLTQKNHPKSMMFLKATKCSLFTCDVCGKLLKSKQNLKYHVKTHTDGM